MTHLRLISLWYVRKTALKRSGQACWDISPASRFAKKRKVCIKLRLSSLFWDLQQGAKELGNREVSVENKTFLRKLAFAGEADANSHGFLTSQGRGLLQVDMGFRLKAWGLNNRFPGWRAQCWLSALSWMWSNRHQNFGDLIPRAVETNDMSYFSYSFEPSVPPYHIFF